MKKKRSMMGTLGRIIIKSHTILVHKTQDILHLLLLSMDLTKQQVKLIFFDKKVFY